MILGSPLNSWVAEGAIIKLVMNNQQRKSAFNIFNVINYK